ncbi:MAG TPA: hypothetical protein VGN26_12900 [Armatimonadota bacterium]|jgi:hypothetical protein
MKGTALWAVLLPLLVADLGPATMEARAQTVEVFSTFMPEVQDPSHEAGLSTVIVSARVAEVPRASESGAASTVLLRNRNHRVWTDVRMEGAKVLFQADPLIKIGDSLTVRVLGGETSSVRMRVHAEPNFVVGERYILCLTDVDTVTAASGPPHWRPVDGSFGAFLVTPDGLQRKGIDPKPWLTLRGVLLDLYRGAGSQKAADSRSMWRNRPRGIPATGG